MARANDDYIDVYGVNGNGACHGDDGGHGVGYDADGEDEAGHENVGVYVPAGQSANQSLICLPRPKNPLWWATGMRWVEALDLPRRQGPRRQASSPRQAWQTKAGTPLGP